MSLTVREEEYLQIIGRLIENKGVAKVSDIASELDISPPSVSEMLNKMKEKGYVEFERYGPISLTKIGERKKNALEKSYSALTKFLVLLGVDEEIASHDACKIEHLINKETIDQVSKFMDFMDHLESPKWLENFHKFCEGKSIPECPKHKMKEDEE
jgi:DtxR family Mn-dependent transcriptional regulator